jgi:hypothetical protein
MMNNKKNKIMRKRSNLMGKEQEKWIYLLGGI